MTELARPERDTSDHGGISDIADAWRILAGGAVVAARALREIASDPEAPAAARVTASKTILVSVGFGQDEVKVPIVPREYDQAQPSSEYTVSSAQIVRDRMAQLKASTRIEPVPDDELIVDAVIVEEPPA
jgi:hypothetical protein